MKFRRHVPQSFDWSRLELPRELRKVPRFRPYTLAFVGAALAGYLVAALILFRAPIFAQTTRVPRVIGLSSDSANSALSHVGLKGREADRVPHPRAAAGQVIWQDPPPDVVVTAGTTVDLSLSAGQQRVPVPDVAGYDEGLARLLLESAGLTVTVEPAQTAAPKGVAVNSRPPAGTAVAPAARVTLMVSQGAPTITVPNVVGLTLEAAKANLEAAGLHVGTSFGRSSTAGNPGTVIEQRPQAGTLSAPGTAVDVTLAKRVQP